MPHRTEPQPSLFLLHIAYSELPQQKSLHEPIQLIIYKLCDSLFVLLGSAMQKILIPILSASLMEIIWCVSSDRRIF